MQGIDVRPVMVVVDAANAAEIGTVEDVAGSSISVALVRAPPLTAEQICWDGKDAQAHALIALSVKRAIIPHIFSCKTTNAKQLRIFGIRLPLYIMQEMRLVLLTSGNM